MVREQGPTQLTPRQLTKVLAANPELIRYANVSNLREHQIIYLIDEVGIDKRFFKDLNDYNIMDYIALIRESPEYFEVVDSREFRGWDVSHILEVQPHLINRFTKDQLNSINGTQMEHLLKLQQDLVDYFDLDIMNDEEKKRLAKVAPRINKLFKDQSIELY